MSNRTAWAFILFSLSAAGCNSAATDAMRAEAAAPSVDRRVTTLEQSVARHEVRLVALEQRRGSEQPPTPPAQDPATPAEPQPILPPDGGGKVPGGVPDWAGEILWFDRPPPHLAATNAWMDGVQDADNKQPGTIEIDWIKVHAIDEAGNDRVISQVDYNNDKAEGGLFSRYPWFGNNDNTPMPTKFKDGALVLEVSTKPDRVWHWWTFPRVNVPANTRRIWTEARVRVTGGAAVEVGYDYFKDLTNTNLVRNVTHAEGARGRWFFATNGWQTITSGKPK